MRGGTNLGRDYYRSLADALLREPVLLVSGPGRTLLNPERGKRTGWNAKHFGISARQARNALKRARRDGLI